MSSQSQFNKKDQVVQKLGQRARARRQEQLNQRREIVRLEEQEPITKRHAPVQLVPKTTIRRPTLKRKRPSSKSKSSKKDDFITSNNNQVIDNRTPDISHLVTVLQDDTDIGSGQSSMVRVHGLPVDCHRGDIMRFFAGLDPRQVFLLPSNPTHIVEWDAKDVEDDGNVVVKRSPPSVRVYVKFDTLASSSLALQRSGEVLYLKPTKGANDGDGDEKQRHGATIAISTVNKRTTKYLLHHMAIEWKHTQTLSEIMTECEEHMDPLVPKVLWSAAKQKLGFTISPKTLPRWNETLHYPPFGSDATNLASDTQQLQAALVQHHNQMLRDHATLTEKLPFPAIAICDSPELMQLPATRLTTLASKQLLANANHIQKFLRMAKTVAHRRDNPIGIHEKFAKRGTGSSV